VTQPKVLATQVASIREHNTSISEHNSQRHKRAPNEAYTRRDTQDRANVAFSCVQEEEEEEEARDTTGILVVCVSELLAHSRPSFLKSSAAAGNDMLICLYH
jgi:hypothetical protein